MRRLLAALVLAGLLGTARGEAREPARVFGAPRADLPPMRAIVPYGENVLCILERGGLEERTLGGDLVRSLFTGERVEGVSVELRRVLTRASRVVSEVRLRDIETGATIARVPGLPNGLAAVGFLGSSIVSVNRAGALRIHDAFTGVARETELATKRWDIRDVAAATSRVFVRADGVGEAWDLGRAVATFTVGLDPDAHVAVDARAERALIAEAKRLTLVDLAAGRRIAEWCHNRARFEAVAFLATTRAIASVARRPAVWDLETGREVRPGPLRFGAVRSLAVSADGRRLISYGDDGWARTWDVASGALVRQELRSASVATIAAVASQAVVTERDVLKLVALPTLATIRTYEGHDQPITDVAMSSDGELALTADHRTVRLWFLRGGWALERLDFVEARPTALAFAPDGRAYYVGFSDGLIHRYER